MMSEHMGIATREVAWIPFCKDELDGIRDTDKITKNIYEGP